MVGLSWECRDPDCNDELEGGEDIAGFGEPTVSDSVLDDSTDTVDSEVEEEARHTYKDDSSLRDQQSTGRKRAARWYPIDDTKLCEWAGQTNCGGGQHPITGCVGNLQSARHHGPDKNTLNNEAGNVHRICPTCHNRWHTLNDEGYDWTALQPPHNPKIATAEDFAENEKFWLGRKLVKAKD